MLLIKPPWYALQDLNVKDIPLGLCYIASILRSADHKCLVLDGDFGFGDPTNYEKIVADYEYYLNALHNIDLPIWKRISSVIQAFKPDIVGIAVMTGTYGAAKNVAEIVKEYDFSIPVIVGGPHPTILPNDTAREDSFDIIVRGEGEYTMLDIVNCLEKGNSLNRVEGITYKKEDNIYNNPPRPFIEDLDSLPIPSRDLIYEKEKYDPDAFGFIITSRGCPYNCIYCSSPKIWGRKVRYRSPENIIAEIEEVIKNFKTKKFRFNDDVFSLNKNRALNICELLINRKLEIAWMCDTRVNLVSYDLLRKMKEAGCRRINLGVESGNPQTLKFIKKKITIEKTKQAFKMARECGIPTTAYFMAGFPNESREQILDTIAFMKDIEPATPCWSIVTPYPGTELYEIAKKSGLLPRISDWSTFFHHSPGILLTNKITKNEFLALIAEIQNMVDKQRLKALILYVLSHPSIIKRRVRMYLQCPKLMSDDLRLWLFKIWRLVT